MEGLILFNKPLGYYSNDIVNFFKKITKNKVGHGGSLDRLAQGLMIIGIGNYTKYLTYFLKKSIKIYLAEIKFGFRSKTFDRESELIKIDNHQSLNLEIISQFLKSFKGAIYQKPPIFSSIKIKGKPAYQLARQGINFDLQPKKVILYDYQIVSFKEDLLVLRLKVSSGFYVRSFANDLGDILNCGAVLWNLIREKIDKFSINQALTFNDWESKFLELLVYLKGRVQGVGFRYYCQKQAQNLNIKGFAQNLKDGRVKILAQGSLGSLIDFLDKVKKGPLLSKVEKVFPIWRKINKNYESFLIC
jgi:tRNA pseudouridine55 synthase